MKNHKVGQDLLTNKINQKQLWVFGAGLSEGAIFWVATAVVVSYVFSQVYSFLSL